MSSAEPVHQKPIKKRTSRALLITSLPVGDETGEAVLGRKEL